MTTGISICSAALLQLGKAPISSFEEAGDAARLCANLYPQERDSLLRENDWNCATKRALLAPLAEAPAYGYPVQFALPADYLRMIGIGDYRLGSPLCRDFKVQGRTILSSGTVLPIEYVFRNDNEGTWDSKLVELMTARMLWKLAYPVTQLTSLRDELKTEYNGMARAARAIDSQENPSQALSDDYTLLVGRQ
ncbi:hypothetical protein J2W30_003617 [Variovorax boronicumulans]|uniref:hypothetical protein n=1 Tax=Variovorax boronicumulans TaxID=436515 RepID=UPI0027880A5D|nr:hypothetical protein [Variovorax boronicumulans]MDQ0035849.1 hypothetical protein [Variovorax boronicumulans]